MRIAFLGEREDVHRVRGRGFKNDVLTPPITSALQQPRMHDVAHKMRSCLIHVSRGWGGAKVTLSRGDAVVARLILHAHQVKSVLAFCGPDDSLLYSPPPRTFRTSTAPTRCRDWTARKPQPRVFRAGPISAVLSQFETVDSPHHAGFMMKYLRRNRCTGIHKQMRMR